MIASVAWKNVWRNKSRSLIVITAVTIGVFAGVFTIAVMNSAVVQRIDAAVNEELSHIQINKPGFRSSGSIQDLVDDSDSIMQAVSRVDGVKAVTGRVIIRGIASTATRSSGVEINGIDTRKEASMFTLAGRIIPGTGTFLGSETKLNSAVIGEKLAKELGIIRYILSDEAVERLLIEGVPPSVISSLEPLKGMRFTSEKKFTREATRLISSSEASKYMMKIREAAWSYREGSKVIFSFLDANDIQTGAAFRVSGIYLTNNDMFEATQVFVPEGELRQLTGLAPGEYHRIIARLDDNGLTETAVREVRSAFPDLEVMSWKEIQPDLAMIADMMQQIYAVFMTIILAALAFGIVNTMLMAVLERTRELGMLAAIGMNRRKIFGMIMLESVYLSVVGGFSGMAFGGAVIAATAKNGLNLVKYSEGLEAFGYTAHLFPSIDTTFFVSTTLLIVITGVLSSIYPARKALSLNPVEAIRGEK